ncbi:peptidoglycan DD-metalloendopeptidase family protein [Maribacter litopenaei]|uniref:Peptidoglycan DD-metalloendopeptidase family protein n=1 Tax=Maribacter litopenaei TaxID=2976127 RepID=A0ABY5YA60_9FLAO|nr:peptidoglycan DD-metalloendopeptidase family protein [Maribacter litopenaei]UWX55912.1 peptidoglycan DD-metalloendopeptidase family protein [Maribacter litopenaei]
MNVLEQLLFSYSEKTIPILDSSIPLSCYVPLDLSVDNVELKKRDISSPTGCQSYIDAVLEQNSGHVAYGGYLEHRNLYADKASFNDKNSHPRNIHLGIDYWAPSGTAVIAPLDGTVHSFKNNNVIGDYGPTIILEHQLNAIVFYSLYGHLSLESLRGMKTGKKFKAGTVLATLGTPDINVNYAPHLHFQIIHDLEGNWGDYPGVCAKDRLDFYKDNCPDPNLLLKIT